MGSDSTLVIWGKVALSWLGTVFSFLLSDEVLTKVSLLLTIAFTATSLFFLLKRNLRRSRDKDSGHGLERQSTAAGELTES